jgi:hypothetical protein
MAAASVPAEDERVLGLRVVRAQATATAGTAT